MAKSFWYLLISTDTDIYQPGVTPGEGGVTSHEEADQQSENYQFCLHSHCPENRYVDISKQVHLEIDNKQLGPRIGI